METKETEYNNKKEEMRRKALERELVRLNRLNGGQKKKINKLRSVCIYLISTSIFIYVILFITGAISFSRQQNNTNTINTSFKTESLEDSIITLNKQLNTLLSDRAITRKEDGYRFKVQFGSFKFNNLDDYKNNLVSLQQEKYQQYNQYTLGSFQNYDKAQRFLEYMNQIGFNDAFIIATYFGKKISVDKALQRSTK